MNQGRTLYLRGLPTELVRATKAEAARRGVTLGAFVGSALRQALEGARPGGVEDLAPDVAWYDANREQLVEQFPGEYLAIVGGKVVDHDREFEPLARRVFRAVGPRPVFMPRAVGEDEVVRAGSPRVVGT